MKKIIFLFILVLEFLCLFGCKKYHDPNEKYYQILGLSKNEKPFHLEKRRVNLDQNPVLEILLVYKLKKETAWWLLILKKKKGLNEYHKVFQEQIAFSEDLLDRFIVKDFFREGFNGVSLEFSSFQSGIEKGIKKFLMYRLPSIMSAKGLENNISGSKSILSLQVKYNIDKKKFQEKSLQTAESKKPPKIKSPIKWEDTNEDGQLELVIQKTKQKGKISAKKKEYAYSRLNRYLGAVIYKFNGIEFLKFELTKPFLYYKKISIPKLIRPGESKELIYKIINLGMYSPKAYISFSFPEKNKVQINALKNLGKIYLPGKTIFHLKRKSYIKSKYPLVEFSIFPWPRKRLYTFRLMVTAAKNTKEDNIRVFYRSSLENKGRSLFTPRFLPEDARNSLLVKKVDQQGFAAYQGKITIIK